MNHRKNDQENDNEERSLWPLKQDIEFKMYFEKYPEMLVPMLEAFLPLPEGSKVLAADLQNPELPDPDGKGKTFILDLRVKIETTSKEDNESAKETHTVNVEMQASSKENLTDRLLAYAGRLYSRQVAKGEDYDKLLSVYSLLFTVYRLEEFSGLVDEYYHTCSIRHDKHPHFVYSKGVKFIVVEFSKFKEEVDDDLDERAKWCYLLKNSETLDLATAKKLQKGDKVMGEAIKNLQDLSTSEDAEEYRQILRSRYESDRVTDLRIAREKAAAEGKAEVAAKMLAEGIDIETICKFTGLGKEEIEKLQKA